MQKLLVLLLLVVSNLLLAQDCPQDTTNPWFVNYIANATVSCDEDIRYLFPIADDDCDTLVDILWYEEVTPGSCPNAYNIFRLYRAVDNAGNQSVETQMIYVVDETAPTFVEIPNTIQVSCQQVIPDAYLQPTATDNCSEVYIDEIVLADSSNAPCEIVITKVWTALDGCGNASTMTQTISYIDDIPPTITGDNYVQVEQGQSLDATFVTVVDDCSEVTMSYEDMEVSGNNIIRNYTAQDACGNTSTFEQIIHTQTNNLVAICHRLGNGNWITIHVAPQAVPAHLAHGDYLGPCNPEVPNQWLPYLNLERVPDGRVRKIVRFPK